MRLWLCDFHVEKGREEQTLGHFGDSPCEACGGTPSRLYERREGEQYRLVKIGRLVIRAPRLRLYSEYEACS